MPRVAPPARHQSDPATIAPSALRRNVTRSRHCLRGFDHGNLSRPAAVNPSARTRAVFRRWRQRHGRLRQRDCVQGFVCGGARRAIAPRSNEISSVVSIWVGEARFDFIRRNRRRQQDSLVRGGAGEFGDRDIGRARQCGGLVDRGATSIGKYKTAIAAVAGDAVGKASASMTPIAGLPVRRLRVSSPFSPLLPLWGGRRCSRVRLFHWLPPARPSAARERARYRRVASGRGPNASSRASRSTLSPPSPRSVRTSRNLGGLPRPRQGGANPRSCAPAAAAAPVPSGSCLPP